MIEELLKYQEVDGKLRAIELEIAATDERKKYMAARKFLEKAPEKLDALEGKAVELEHYFGLLEKKYAELADTLKDYEHLDEMIGEQGGEIAFYKRSASQIAESLRGLKAEINKLAAQIEAASKEYRAAKKQTIAMQNQYKEYKDKYADVKKERAKEMQEVETKLAVLAKKIPSDVLEKYKAKRKEKMYPVLSACSVSEKRCSQCGMELSIAEVEKLSSGVFIECDSCHRILFAKK